MRFPCSEPYKARTDTTRLTLRGLRRGGRRAPSPTWLHHTTDRPSSSQRADPAGILLDADGLAARYGICIDVARHLFDLDGFPSITVSDRRRLVPLVALRHWELVTSMPPILAILEPPTVLAPPAWPTPEVAA